VQSRSRMRQRDAKAGRRSFLKTLTAVAGSCWFSGADTVCGAGLAQRLHMGAQTNAWGVPIREYSRLLEIAETLVRLGYTGFETNFASLSSQVSRAAACRRDFASRHIQLIAPHTGGVLYDKDKWPSEFANFQRVAGESAQMGARYLIVSGKEVPHPDGKLDLEAVHAKAKALDQLGAAVKEDGVRLCYHNHESEFRDKPTEMSYLLAETDPDRVWLCLDVGHCYGFEDPADFTAANFRRIAIFHLRDETRSAAGKVIYAEPGKGGINLKGIVTPLLQSDWEGWLEIEEEQYYPKPMPDPEKAMKEWREYLRQLTGV
jgi:sugar phosphate isomerase/epimerase